MALAQGEFVVGGLGARFTFGSATFDGSGAASVGSVAIGADSLVFAARIDSAGVPGVDPASITPSTDEDTADGSFDATSTDGTDGGDFAYLIVGY